jgi:SAM-dependent methyltransferase
MIGAAQTHYDAFLAGRYTWIHGAREDQIRKNQDFFSFHSLTPGDKCRVIDLGAGSGFQSVPLALLGYSVIAVDFCQLLLDELLTYAGALQIETIRCDILQYSSWAGRRPELIVCMGDTLTHLPSLAKADDLISHCFSELIPEGRLVLTLRDYSRDPDGAVVVIPVLRDNDRIFLCRLEYHTSTLTVTDILYSRERGVWERTAGKYEKIRIGPDTLTRLLTRAGFGIDYSAVNDGMITVIARKSG